MMREDIKTRIDELASYEIVNASTLRPRLTETLLKIIDECSTLNCYDKFDRQISPAALRAVAVNAVNKLTEMYGIKEDIAHKIAIESGDGNGITFNVIVPEKQIPGEDLIG
jgi:Holliday junction resolvasome RuvABC ATP-dependent DNA helicase subunit